MKEKNNLKNNYQNNNKNKFYYKKKLHKLKINYKMHKIMYNSNVKDLNGLYLKRKKQVFEKYMRLRLQFNGRTLACRFVQLSVEMAD